jgi:hypothetical protein
MGLLAVDKGQGAGFGLSKELRIGDDPSALEIRNSRPERDEGAAPVRALYLEQVAGAEILDRDHGAERLAGGGFAVEADQISMIIFPSASGGRAEIAPQKPANENPD